MVRGLWKSIYFLEVASSVRYDKFETYLLAEGAPVKLPSTFWTLPEGQSFDTMMSESVCRNYITWMAAHLLKTHLLQLISTDDFLQTVSLLILRYYREKFEYIYGLRLSVSGSMYATADLCTSDLRTLAN